MDKRKLQCLLSLKNILKIEKSKIKKEMIDYRVPRMSVT